MVWVKPDFTAADTTLRPVLVKASRDYTNQFIMLEGNDTTWKFTIKKNTDIDFNVSIAKLDSVIWQ